MRNILSSLLLVAILIMIPGCGQPETKPLEEGTRQEDKTGLTSSDRRVLADQLSTMAEAVDGVKTATVVISDLTVTSNEDNGGDRDRTDQANDNNNQRTNATEQVVTGLIVMVGLTLEEGADEARVKRSVRDKLIKENNNLSQVLVTSDPELVKRINDVAAGVIEGQPIQNFDDDLKEIGRQLRQDDPAL